jgi:predicted MFS family arabinose efflux permease
MSTIMDIGQAAGPVLMGGLLALFSYHIGFGVTGAVVLVCAILFQWLAVEER